MSVNFNRNNIYDVIRSLWKAATFEGYKNDSFELPMTNGEIQMFLQENENKIDIMFGKTLNVDFSTFPLIDSTSYEEIVGKGVMSKIADDLNRRSTFNNYTIDNVDSIVKSVINKFLEIFYDSLSNILLTVLAKCSEILNGTALPTCLN